MRNGRVKFFLRRNRKSPWGTWNFLITNVRRKVSAELYGTMISVCAGIPDDWHRELSELQEIRVQYMNTSVFLGTLTDFRCILRSVRLQK